MAPSLALSEVPLPDSGASDFPFPRRIEFLAARKPFDPYLSMSKGDFHLETLNPGYGGQAAAGTAGAGRSAGKRPDVTGELAELGIDPDIDFGITFRKIGAGLYNLGNTCFLNSVLQCLTYTEPFAAYLQSGRHKSSCRTAGFCALCAIQNHVRNALQSTGKILSPFHLVKNLRCISRNFRSCRQEDAHEYMVNLLESMHKCCLPYGVSSESPAAYEESLVHKIFGGSLRSQIKCTQCSFCSNKFDPFLDLSLEIARADSLYKALVHFTAKEQLDGGEKQYQCQRCKQKVQALKQLTVHKAPYVLTVHLKRFGSHNPGQKIDKKINFSPSLDLKPFVSGPCVGDLKYTLYGVLVHAGWSTHSGHYYCFVRTSSGMWYTLDDNRVFQVSERTVLEQKAYMLFYVRDRRNLVSKVPKAAKENETGTIVEKVQPAVAMDSKPLGEQSQMNNVVKAGRNTSGGLLSTNPFSFLITDKMVEEMSRETNASEPVVKKSETYKSLSVNESISKEVQLKNSHLTEQMPKITAVKDLDSSSKEESPRMQVDPHNVAHVPCQPSVVASGLVSSPKVGGTEAQVAEQISRDESCPPSIEVSNSFAPAIKSIYPPLSSGPGLSLIPSCICLNIQHSGILHTKELSVMSTGEAYTSGLGKCEIQSGELSTEYEKVKTEEPYNQSNGHIENDFNGEERFSGTRTCMKDDIADQKVACIVSEKVAVNSGEAGALVLDANISGSPELKENVGYTMPATHLIVSKKLFFSSLAVRRKKKLRKLKHKQSTNMKKAKNGLMDESSSNDQETSTSKSHEVNECAYVSLKKRKHLRKTKRHVNTPFNDDKRVIKNGSLFSVPETMRQSKEGNNFFKEQIQSTERHVCNNGGANQNVLTLMLQGLEGRSVAQWDGIEVSSTEVLGAVGPQMSSIGYVADAWDEEIDRGKRRKVRKLGNLFDGSNPFQAFATEKVELKKKVKHHKKHWNSRRHWRKFS